MAVKYNKISQNRAFKDITLNAFFYGAITLLSSVINLPVRVTFYLVKWLSRHKKDLFFFVFI